MHKRTFPLLLMACLASGCTSQVLLPGVSTPTAFIITSTLAPTAVPTATLTPIPPTPSPTIVPIEGLTTTQVNARAEPSTAATQLGIIGAFGKVLITGRDAGNNWYQIQYAGGPDGKAWVTAQYINVLGKQTIPIVSLSAASPASGTAGPSVSGTISEQVNVRKGPGTSFDALGTLNPNDAVTLTGKDASGAWLQIAYSAAPDGKGWVAATYVQADGLDSLPIVDASGIPVGSGTAVSTPPALTPTPAAALQDNDSAASPATNVVFSPAGTRTLLYSSDVSAPEGDSEDWIQFTPYATGVTVSLNCSGSGSLNVALESNEAPINDWGGLSCGETKALSLSAGKPYQLRLSVVESPGTLEYVRYSLRVEAAGS